MTTDSTPLVWADCLGKTFTLHNPTSGVTDIPVFADLTLKASAGECVVLAGASGIGKSTLMRSIFGNYLPSAGRVRVLHDGAYVDICQAAPGIVIDVRRRTLGYVSQFLRVIPRVPTLALVMEPLLDIGVARDEAEQRAATLLGKLRLPENLWSLPPATFSGGEQQRVNIARSFAAERPVMLLDEPTASLDAGNRETVIELIHEALGAGVAMIGIFHDADVREQVGTRVFDVEAYRAVA